MFLQMSVCPWGGLGCLSPHPRGKVRGIWPGWGCLGPHTRGGEVEGNLPMGGSAQGGIYAGGCLPRGGSAQGGRGCLPRGGVCWGVSAQGGVQAHTPSRQLLLWTAHILMECILVYYGCLPQFFKIRNKMLPVVGIEPGTSVIVV